MPTSREILAYTFAMRLTWNHSDLPVRFRPAHPFSDEELMRFCAANNLLRIEREKDGELALISPTGAEGSGRNAELTIELGTWARGDDRSKVFDSNTGFTLPDSSMRSPDASWVSWARWNAISAEEQNAFLPYAPNLSSSCDRSRIAFLNCGKMQVWIANGADLAWLIDPSRKAVEIYRSGRLPRLSKVRAALLAIVRWRTSYSISTGFGLTLPAAND